MKNGEMANVDDNRRWLATRQRRLIRELFYRRGDRRLRKESIDGPIVRLTFALAIIRIECTRARLPRV